MIHLSIVLELYSVRSPYASNAVEEWEQVGRPVLQWANDTELPLQLSVNWSLLQRWGHAGIASFQRLLEELAAQERCRFLHTSGYHAILPLLPSREIVRQIDINARRFSDAFPQARWSGLFPTELAYGNTLPRAALRLGLPWILADDIAYGCVHQEVPYRTVVEADGVPCVLRSSFWSNAIAHAPRENGSGKALAERLVQEVSEWFGEDDGYLVLALEAQSVARGLNHFFGPFCEALMASSQVEVDAIDSIVERFPTVAGHVPPGSWLSRSQDILDGAYYPSWQDASSRAHNLLWELTDLAVDSVEGLRDRLDRSLASGTYWWSSERSHEIPEGTASGMKALLELVSQTNPRAMGRALALVAELETAYRENSVYRL